MNKNALIGIAVCLAILLLGIIGSTITIAVVWHRNIRSKEKFGDENLGYLRTIPSNNYYEFEAGIQSFEITCEGTGYSPSGSPEWSLKWTDPRGNDIWDRSGSPAAVVTSKNSLQLRFRSPTGRDSGVYTCSGSQDKRYQIPVTIHFNRGTTAVTTTEETPPTPFHDYPQFDVKYKEVTADEESDLQLHCSAKGAEPLTYLWSNQRGVPITNDTSSSIYTSTGWRRSYLIIKSVNRSEEGEYSCVAVNNFGTAIKKFYVSLSRGLTKFNRTFEYVTAEERSKLELFCCDENDDGTTNYTWYNQHNHTVTSNQESVVYSSTTLKGSVLTINPVNIHHNGLYECRAKSNQGVASKLYDVSVSPVSKNLPSFDNDYQYVLAEEGSTLELQCSASGEGPMQYEWQNQREEIIPFGTEQSVSVNVTTSDNASVLVIKNVQFSHKKAYICRAENQFGTNSKVFKISVYPSTRNDTDEYSISHVEVQKVTSNSVLFGIAISGPVDVIEVKYTEAQDKQTEYNVTFKTGDDYVVKDLVAGGLYDFRFRTPSSTNTSWSEVYKVTLLPEKVEVIIRDMQPDNLEIEFFTTVDMRMRGTILKREISYYQVAIERGTYWKPSPCAVNVTLPSCYNSYAITGLATKTYYELKIRAFTTAGFGEAYTHKFYVP